MRFTEVVTTLKTLISEPQLINRIFFASSQQTVPELAYKVNFPRLEVILEGDLYMEWKPGQANINAQNLHAGDVLFVPEKAWNYPHWEKPVTTLSILFGKQQIGFSILKWEDRQLINIGRQNVARLGPRVGSYLLMALNELAADPREQETAQWVVKGLLSHCLDLLSSRLQTASRSQALFSAVCEYIDECYYEPLSRESVAQDFYVSPNYLSHLFKKNGSGFNEYLNHTRLEHAKNLLKGYDLKIKELAHACGYEDSNYFCRLFRKMTERSPSDYRRHYHSQLTDKES
jgi:AraC-like DNA-binding protein